MLERNLEGEVPSVQFQQALDDASSLVAMIDGFDVLDLIMKKGVTERRAATKAFEKKYLTILQTIHAHSSKKQIHGPGNGKPVHFVLTKWDLFKREGVSLAQAIDTLRGVDQFRQYIKNRESERLPVRIIPVSSIGMNFAIPNGRAMTKLRDAVPNGLNLELPLACALYDDLEISVEALRTELAKRDSALKVRRFRRTRPVLDILKRMKLHRVQKLLSDVAPLPWPMRVGIYTAVAVVDRGKGAVIDRVEKAMEQEPPPVELTPDERRGRELAYAQFTSLVTKLNKDEPDNRIVT
jgi:hypothetical protein